MEGLGAADPVYRRCQGHASTVRGLAWRVLRCRWLPPGPSSRRLQGRMSFATACAIEKLDVNTHYAMFQIRWGFQMCQLRRCSENA